MPILAACLALGGALGLAPSEDVPPPSTAPTTLAVPDPVPPPPMTPDAVAALLGISVAMAALLMNRGPGSALGLRPPEDALVVFVPGHGQPHASEAFEDFIDLARVSPESARFFDYRWVTGGGAPSKAAELAPIDRTAAALNAYVGAVAEQGRPIWLVGFSKGGATVAHLIAEWDRGAFGPAGGVEGALLLEPPLAAGVHGWLQSSGRHIGWVPDDGGYEPVRCSFLGFGCRDTRIGLGSRSGVDVVVVRNPRAAVTTFLDHPAGLRVVEAPDDGPGPWQQLFRNPVALPARIASAHDSVLSDPAVARCLVQEMWDPGSCSLPEARPPAPDFPWQRGKRFAKFR